MLPVLHVLSVLLLGPWAMLCTHAQRKQKERQEFRGSHCIRTFLPADLKLYIWFGYVILQVMRTKVQINQITFPRVQKTKPLKLLVSVLALSLSWPLVLLRLINSDVKPGAGVLVILIAVKTSRSLLGCGDEGPAPISVLSPGRGRLRQGLLPAFQPQVLSSVYCHPILSVSATHLSALGLAVSLASWCDQAEFMTLVLSSVASRWRLSASNDINFFFNC